MAKKPLTVEGEERLMGLLAAGDPKREVWYAWNAKEVVRQIYDHTDHQLAVAWVTEIGRDFADASMPIEHPSGVARQPTRQQEGAVALDHRMGVRLAEQERHRRDDPPEIIEPEWDRPAWRGSQPAAGTGQRLSDDRSSTGDRWLRSPNA